MYCTNCGGGTRVIDSRESDNGLTIRRRRECENCGNRFTTYEKREGVNLIVIKSGNKKEKYDRGKIEDSLLKATNKRNISILEINTLIDNLETNWGKISEISSKQIGEDILEELKKLDEVAYIRYASVHKNFKSALDFINFIQNNINF